MKVRILDKETNMRLMEASENKYLVSMSTLAKAMIDVLPQDEDLLMKVHMQETCTVEELTKIIELFSGHIYATRPEVNGILFKCDENELLTNIGFKPISEESEFLYQENNKRDNKEKGKK